MLAAITKLSRIDNSHVSNDKYMQTKEVPPIVRMMWRPSFIFMSCSLWPVSSSSRHSAVKVVTAGFCVSRMIRSLVENIDTQEREAQ